MNKRIQIDKLVFLIFFLISYYTFIHHLNNEIWNDEYYTINHFVLVPLKTTLLDYHVPNNHILFSILIKLYLNLIGFVDLKTIIENPFVSRIPLAIVAVLTLNYFWKSTIYFFKDILWRSISLLLLVSNVVFGNFIFQYRGYGIGMLFLTLLFYQLLRIIYDDKISWKTYLALLIFSFASFYTSPSNLYFLIALGLFPAIKYSLDKNNITDFFKSTSFRSGLFILFGILLSLLAYSPIFKEVFNNEYVTNSSPFAFTNFERMFKALLSLSSFHFVLFGFGIYYLIYNFVKKQIHSNSRFWFPFLICTLPCFFSFLHGDVPPDRVYSVIVPFFTILLTQSLFLFLQKLNLLNNQKLYLIIPICILIHFSFSELYLFEKLGYDNSNGDRDQNLTLQYHNYHFNSLGMIKILKSDSLLNLPIFYEENFDNTKVLTDVYGIKSKIVSMDSIKSKSYILLSNKAFSEKAGMTYKLINSDKQYFKLYKVEVVKR